MILSVIDKNQTRLYYGDSSRALQQQSLNLPKSGKTMKRIIHDKQLNAWASNYLLRHLKMYIVRSTE